MSRKILSAYEMLKAGATIGKVAKRLNLSESLVKRVLRGKHHAIRHRGRAREGYGKEPISQEAKFMAIGMARQGKTAKEIMKKTGLTKSTVYRLMSK